MKEIINFHFFMNYPKKFIFTKNVYRFIRQNNLSLVNSQETKTILTVINSSKIDLNFFLINNFVILLQDFHSGILNSRISKLKKDFPLQIFDFINGIKNLNLITSQLEEKDYQNFIIEILN